MEMQIDTNRYEAANGHQVVISLPQTFATPMKDVLPQVASPIPAAPPPGSSPNRKAKQINRQLTPHKIGVAWEKVRRVVRDLCRQRGPECLLCSLYGNRIEFQLTANHRPITLDLDGDRIVARIAHKRRTLRIVRIKTGGSGYQLRRKIHTATSMLIDLLLEARQ
jgi:hypothetical protein